MDLPVSMATLEINNTNQRDNQLYLHVDIPSHHKMFQQHSFVDEVRHLRHTGKIGYMTQGSGNNSIDQKQLFYCTFLHISLKLDTFKYNV